MWLAIAQVWFVQIPLQGLITLYRVNSSTQFGINETFKSFIAYENTEEGTGLRREPWGTPGSILIQFKTINFPLNGNKKNHAGSNVLIFPIQRMPHRASTKCILLPFSAVTAQQPAAEPPWFSARAQSLSPGRNAKFCRLDRFLWHLSVSVNWHLPMKSILLQSSWPALFTSRHNLLEE